MDTRESLFIPHVISACIMTAMLAFPCIVKAELSGKPADKSHLEKISDEEITLLLEQQKLLVPSVLAMQQKLKLVQDELDAVKLQMAHLEVNSHHAAATMRLASGAQQKSPEHGFDGNQTAMQQDNPYFHDDWVPAFWLVLFMLILWLGLRYSAKIKSRSRSNLQQGAGASLKTANDSEATARLRVSPHVMPPAQVNGQVSPAVLPSKPSTARHAVPTASPSPKKAEKNLSEDDSMLEEAGLYAANGRMGKAAGILHEIIERNPAKVGAWKLLLSVYSALCKVADFERVAREFLKHHKASPSWSGIQVLGRTLDRDNPLYADQNSQISADPLLLDTLNLHRPIGDILIEMGSLSQREILKYLDEFDPKQHGRFGGYLVARKAITIAQLDQALLQQQGLSPEAKPGGLPSLQDIEKFLIDFDPKQHGSVSKFLASRNVVTPEQLGQLLRQSSSQGAMAKNTQADIPLFGELSTS